MKIAVDCRYIGGSGIGRVCSEIIKNLDYDQNEYFLIGKEKDIISYSKAKIIVDNSNPYSTKGLFKFNKIINKECDALLIPNFLIPFGVKIPTFTIMHDVMFLDVKETTKGFSDKLIKRLLLKRCMKKSKAVSCVSNFTLKRCERYYKKLSKKCFVNYNGISGGTLTFDVSNVTKENTLVYVGNVKKHKGLDTLVNAYKMLPKGEYKLKIIGEKDKFLNGMNTADLEYDGVEFTGRLDDNELFTEMAKAKFLIQPSLYEGFGLPPIEAICLNTKPIVSDIEIFKEVYDGFDVEFFEVGNANSLKEKILNASFDEKTTREQVYERFNYKDTAQKLEKTISEILSAK